MAERRKVGLIYKYNENWIGGIYYIQNLVSALNLLPDVEKPILNVYIDSEEHFNELANLTNYPYLYKKKYGKFRRGIIKISRAVFGKLIPGLFSSDIHDIVFPAAREYLFSSKQTFLYWIPDFQEHYLPHFFKPDELKSRKEYQNNLVRNAKHLILSSTAAQKNFNDIYPTNRLTQHVLRFAVSHNMPRCTDEDIHVKYKIPGEYFICSNQFWIHKNHKVILEAIRLLKNRNVSVFVAFTGKEYDNRNPEYFSQLKVLASNLDVQDNIKFLGFISREDQITLMKKALAVLQPSLFEGWSTLIEDAKAIKQSIIASEILVHQEQLQDYNLKVLFPVDDAFQLAKCMEENLKKLPKRPHDYNYENNVLEFGRNFINIVDKIRNRN